MVMGRLFVYFGNIASFGKPGPASSVGFRVAFSPPLRDYDIVPRIGM